MNRLKNSLLFLFLISILTATAQQEIRVNVMNLTNNADSSWSFDISLEILNADTAYIGFGELVFGFDTTQFTDPKFSVTSAGILRSQNNNTFLNKGYIRSGYQHNENKGVYTFGALQPESAIAFDDGVITLRRDTIYEAYTFTVNGYTGTGDPEFRWIESGKSNENQSQLYTFTGSRSFQTEKATLVFDDFPTPGSFQLDVRIALHGAYDTANGMMRTSLNTKGYLPLKNPYSAAPWNYSGADSVPVIPGAQVVDWVLVELREANIAAHATEDSILARKAGFLLNDGRITDLDGSSLLSFEGLEPDPDKKLFVAVFHRNHLPVLSAQNLYQDTTQTNVFAYDFTANINSVYGANLGARTLSGTHPVVAMYSGDSDSDGNIYNTDIELIWLVQKGLSGYYPADYNLDGNVFNTDREIYWFQNKGKSNQLP